MELDKIIKLNAEKLNLRAVASDGGTAYIEVAIQGEDGYFFYIDGRIGSPHNGQIFNEYPDEPNAIMLDSSSNLAKSIKELYSKVNDTLRN